MTVRPVLKMYTQRSHKFYVFLFICLIIYFKIQNIIHGKGQECAGTSHNMHTISRHIQFKEQPFNNSKLSVAI